jgi:hypothetical protein|tara:strand:+ start:147 stop:1949 length:1803 start_codon:yes stop_codon:yes gene_type:complete
MFRPKSSHPPVDDLQSVLPAAKQKRLESQWPGIFRREILPMLLEAEADFAALYHGRWGAPNKPVAELLGILILKEFHDYTDEQTLEAVEFNLQWQYALQVGLSEAFVCQKTLHNFRDRLVQSQHHQRLFHALTGQIIERFGLDTTRQRMDSTQVVGAMKQLSRLGLFVQTIETFLFKLQRMASKEAKVAVLLDQLPKQFHERYLDRAGYFSDTRSSLAPRRLDACAQDLWALIDRFRGHPKISCLKQYRHLERLFKEQCEIPASPPAETGERLEGSSAPERTGSASSGPSFSDAAEPDPEEGSSSPAVSSSDEEAVSPPEENAASAPHEAPGVGLKDPEQIASTSLQNPSDPDATYGHKGKGYQLQLVETCVPDNAFQVITTTQLQGAHQSDQKATLPLLKTLEEQDRKPQVAFADSNYVSGENIVAAQAMDVDLHGPLPGRAPASDQMTLHDFRFDPSGQQVEACPYGQPPSRQKPAREGPGRRAYFDRSVCDGCPQAAGCPTHVNRTERGLRWTPIQWATARRRYQQDTPAFKDAYKIRSGIEATISEDKNGHGLGRLRVRGQPAIDLVSTFKALAINVKRTLKYVQNTLKNPVLAPG